MKKYYSGILITMLLILAMALPALAERKTRDLVFEEEDDAVISEKAKDANIANPEAISVQTSLDLTRNGETVSVLPNHEFRSGDKVKLRYTTNADGYVYWMAKMSSGTYKMLFPNPETGMDNFIRRNEEHTVPVKGAFRFDDTPGTESLLMVFSPNKIAELEQAVAEASGGGAVQEQATEVARLEDDNTSKRKTRDLVFEEEEDEEAGVSTQSQIAPQGEPFVASYELIHK